MLRREKRSIAWIYTTYRAEDFTFTPEQEWSDSKKELYINQIIEMKGNSVWKEIEMQEEINDLGTVSYVLAGTNMVMTLIDFIQGGICYEFEKIGFSKMSRDEQDQFLGIKLPILIDEPIKNKKGKR